jgi:hypothetical protein
VSGSACGSKSAISSKPRRTTLKRSSATNERSGRIENDRAKSFQSSSAALGGSLAFANSHRSKALDMTKRERGDPLYLICAGAVTFAFIVVMIFLR